MKTAIVFPRYKYPSGDPPLGALSIVSYLRSQGLHVDIIDTTFHRDRSVVLNLLKKADYDIVGFSVMTTMLRDALFIAEHLKQSGSPPKIVFGGPHPTVLPDDTLKNSCVDAICIGEGEDSWLALLKNHGDFSDVPGFWWKKAGAVIKNKPQGFIADLDSLPFPNLELVDLNQYFAHWFQMDSVDHNLKGINIISSRGCPYNCTFCQPTLTKIFGKKIRKRSPESIVSELSYWKARQGINAFMFQDDTLIFDKAWVHAICDALIEAKLNLRWACNARANLVDFETFAKMKAAGLAKVNIGIESGSQRVLDDIYCKGITLKQVRDSVRILKSLGLRIQGYFMIGAPTETKDEIGTTLKFARSLDIDEATFSITTPLPQTFLYDKTKAFISADVSDFDYYKTPVYSGNIVLPKKQLSRLKQKALLSFYLSPKRISSTLKGFISPAAIKKSLVKLKRF